MSARVDRIAVVIACSALLGACSVQVDETGRVGQHAIARDEAIAATVEGANVFPSGKGTHTLPGGGKVDIVNNWDDMGVQDEPGYTGIDTKCDGPLIRAEQRANQAAGGEACIFGAHGYDPDGRGGQTAIQSFPGGTSPTICHAEYHPECANSDVKWVLSVCYAGKPGTNGFDPTMNAFMQHCGVDPSRIIACTGRVLPGNPMVCDGKIVDGNGTEIGEQTVGGLRITQSRGPLPKDALTRCEDTCAAEAL